MKFFVRGAYILLFVPLCAMAQGSGTREAIERVVAKVKPALVRIHVVAVYYDEGRENHYESFGSGAIVTKEGHVVTNHHVAGDATRLSCTLSNREEMDAVLIGSDPMTDIAIIKLMPDTPQEFPFVAFGDSTAVRVGDSVMAMGSPLSLSQSVTLGIVSNAEMIMPRRMFGAFEQDGEDVGALVRWIAHDAVIFPGNSGGPLVDMNGDIIGINEIGVGLGGAIPGSLAKGVAQELMERGTVRRSWIGMGARPLLKQQESIGRGVLVTDVLEGAPAHAAGVQSGDLVVRLAGKDIHVQFEEQMPEFNGLVAGLPIGQPFELTVLRNGEEKTLTVTTIEREKVRPKERELKQWGITGRNLSYVMSKELKRESRDGVSITSVRPGGPAGDAKPSINNDDVLIAVNDTPIKDLDSLAALSAEIAKGASEPVPVLATFERKTGTYVTVVKVGIKELNDPGLEVKKAWLPVDTQVITRDIAEKMGSTDLKGFRLIQVYKGSTAEKAGLKVGDLVTAVDGEPLTASAPEHYEELPTLIREYSVGASAELSIVRDGQPMKVAVELVRAPLLDREMRKYRDDNFDFTVREITFFDKAKEQWKDDQAGVLVEEVKPGGWAALGELNTNDLVLGVGEVSTTDLAAFAATMKGLAESKPENVVLRVRRGIYTVYVELQPRWDS